MRDPLAERPDRLSAHARVICSPVGMGSIPILPLGYQAENHLCATGLAQGVN